MDKDKLKKDLTRIADAYKNKGVVYWREEYLNDTIGKLNKVVERGEADSWQMSVLETTIVFKLHSRSAVVENWAMLPANRPLWFKNVILTSETHEQVYKF